MALSETHFDKLRHLVGAGVALLAATGAEVYISNVNTNTRIQQLSKKAQGKKKWVYSGISGALCFTCDSKGVHYFRVFRFKDKKEVFSVELADDLQYIELTKQFHYFESADCLCGFNFGDKSGAEKFQYVIRSRLPKKITKVDSKAAAKRPSVVERKKTKKGNKVSFFGKAPSKRKSKRRSKNRRYSKASSRDSNGKLMYSPDDLTPEWKRILKEAGITKKNFKTPKIQKLIQKILTEQNISLTPPPDLSADEAKTVFNESEFQAYEKFKKEEKAYEDDYQRYLENLERFNQNLHVRPTPRTTSAPSTENMGKIQRNQTGVNTSSLPAESSFNSSARRGSFTPIMLPSKSSRGVAQNVRENDHFNIGNTFKRALVRAPTPPPTTDNQSVIHNTDHKPVFNLMRPIHPALPPVKPPRPARASFTKVDEIEQELDDFFDDEKFSAISKAKNSKATRYSKTPRESVDRANRRKDSLVLMTNTDLRKPPVPPPRRRESKIGRDSKDKDQFKRSVRIVEPPRSPSPKLSTPPTPKQPDFFQMLRSQKHALRHVSALPDLHNVASQQKQTILGNLQAEMHKRRQEISNEDDDEDAESDWSW